MVQKKRMLRKKQNKDQIEAYNLTLHEVTQGRRGDL